MLEPLKAAPSEHSQEPREVDLRECFARVYDQQGLNASPAHACVDLVQYFEHRSHGKWIEPSKLFLYKVTRKLLGVVGNTGTDLRTTLKAMVCFGLPPERYWPYDVEAFDDEPGAFLYSFAKQSQSIRYMRLDSRNATGSQTLRVVRSFLAAGLPSVFGFCVPDSLTRESDVPYRRPFDRSRGGQAVVAVGYDDRRRTGSGKGALLFRNSWGHRWGEDGYGWLPYVYVEEQLAVDFWTIVRPDWLESDEFMRPRILA